jgi:hypothetical protein
MADDDRNMVSSAHDAAVRRARCWEADILTAQSIARASTRATETPPPQQGEKDRGKEGSGEEEMADGSVGDEVMVWVLVVLWHALR